MTLSLVQEKKLLKVVASLEKDMDKLLDSSFRNEHTVALSILAKIEYLKLFQEKEGGLLSLLS